MGGKEVRLKWNSFSKIVIEVSSIDACDVLKSFLHDMTYNIEDDG